VIHNTKEQTMTRITTNHRITRIALLLTTAVSIAATVGGGSWG